MTEAVPLFLLDTCTVSYALRGEAGIVERIKAHRPSELHISSVTLAELLYGVEKKRLESKQRAAKLEASIEDFISGVTVELFDVDAARAYAAIQAHLVAAGTTIGIMDSMIAGHAYALGMTVVTTNVAHFERVRGLYPAFQIQNWR